MSAELIDFRGKVTTETNAVLEAMNRATGKDKSEIVREILHEWAQKQIDMHSILQRLLRSEGGTGE